MRLPPVILPKDTVRGRIQSYIREKGEKLRGPVIEIGSRWPHGNADWADNRRLFPFVDWMGVDFRDGPGVDTVCPADKLPFGDGSFCGAVHSETLEHIISPVESLRELARVLIPGAVVLVTTLVAFPIHDHPYDYWRFTPDGLKAVMEKAGFKTVEISTQGYFQVKLNNTGREEVTRDIPIHVFGEFVR